MSATRKENKNQKKYNINQKQAEQEKKSFWLYFFALKWWNVKKKICTFYVYNIINYNIKVKVLDNDALKIGILCLNYYYINKIT